MVDLIMAWMLRYGTKDVDIRETLRPITAAEYGLMRQQGMLHVENYYKARLTEKALEMIKNDH